MNAFAERGVTVLRPLPGGHRNAVWLVERDGARLVAKTTRHSEASLRWLLPVLGAARVAGLNPPRLIPDGEGRLAPGGLTLEPFIDGAHASPADVRALAPRLSAFHARLRRYPARPFNSCSRAPRAHRLRLLRAMNRLGPERTIVHGDLTPANLLLGADGPVLLDWDEARRDHPAFDLPPSASGRPIREARLAHEIVSGWHVEPGHARNLAHHRTHG